MTPRAGPIIVNPSEKSMRSVMNNVKFYSVPGERGFPQHIIREQVSVNGVVNRQMVATCAEAKHAPDVVSLLNEAVASRATTNQES